MSIIHGEAHHAIMQCLLGRVNLFRTRCRSGGGFCNWDQIGHRQSNTLDLGLFVAPFEVLVGGTKNSVMLAL